MPYERSSAIVSTIISPDLPPTEPTLSIVTTAYNERALIGEAIRSALGQTFRELELIVVDDGSSDGTHEVVERFTDPRLRLIRQENMGLSSARNTGIAQARGRYVAFLDSDDLLMPDYAEKMVAALEAAPGAGFGYTDAWWYDETRGRFNRRSVMSGNRPPQNPPADPADFLRLLVQANFIFVSTTVRRSLFEDLGGFEPSLTACEDYDMWMRILAAGHGAVVVPGRNAVKRDRIGQMTAAHDNMARNLVATYRRLAANQSAPADVREAAEAFARQIDAQRAAADTPLESAKRIAIAARNRLRYNRDWPAELPTEPTEAFPHLARTAPSGALAKLLRQEPGEPDVFGSERSFAPPIGTFWRDPKRPGYYIDFRLKVQAPLWPPAWLPPRDQQLHVATVQWGLGAYEHYLHGAGDEYLQAAIECADHLISIQEESGPQRGGWTHLFPMPHTYHLRPGWLSAITQGEAASFFVRLYLETGEQRFAEAARLALLPMMVSVEEGGTYTTLDGDPYVEEYPSQPSSYVLNGAIFALWGFYDVGRYLGDEAAAEQFESFARALARNLHRYDTGRWSLYDLFPHRFPNIASPAYHGLHIKQLRVLNEILPDPAIPPTIQKFESYRVTTWRRLLAIAGKVIFRIQSPRNQLLAHRLPWSQGSQGVAGFPLVLCYHAVSETWPAELSTTPEKLSQQLEHLQRSGYRGATFSDVTSGRVSGKVVAITFDDAYRSVLTKAKPILDRFNMPGTVFVPTSFAGSEAPMAWPGIDHWLDSPHREELVPLSWEELKALQEAGWEIGSHTATHPHLTELEDTDLRRELVESREEVERRLGTTCTAIAYPYGDVDARVAEVAANAGYEFGAALPGDQGASFSQLEYPRVGIYYADDLDSYRRKTAPLARRVRFSPLWPLVARLWRLRGSLMRAFGR